MANGKRVVYMYIYIYTKQFGISIRGTLLFVLGHSGLIGSDDSTGFDLRRQLYEKVESAGGG